MPRDASYDGSLKLKKGEHLAFYVGTGGDGYEADSIGLEVTITSQ